MEEENWVLVTFDILKTGSLSLQIHLDNCSLEVMENERDFKRMLTTLPYEILLCVMENLSPLDITIISQTCKLLNEISSDESVWKAFGNENWKKQSNSSWKQLYLDWIRPFCYERVNRN